MKLRELADFCARSLVSESLRTTGPSVLSVMTTRMPLHGRHNELLVVQLSSARLDLLQQLLNRAREIIVVKTSLYHCSLSEFFGRVEHFLLFDATVIPHVLVNGVGEIACICTSTSIAVSISVTFLGVLEACEQLLVIELHSLLRLPANSGLSLRVFVI